MVIKKEITASDCNLWIINKNVNPLTNRKITSKSPIYKKFEKKCLENKSKDIYNIVDDFCSSIIIPSKMNKKDIQIYDKINNLCSKKEIKLLKTSISPPKKVSFNYLKSLSSLKSMGINEINKKNMKLISYFSNFKQNKCLELTENKNQYLLSNNILLYKQIGSPSVYGVVYKSKNINPEFKEIPRFIAKIQLLRKETKQELSIFQALSNYALKNNICHFPILYSSSICNTIIRDNNYPDILAKAKKQFKNYSIMLYELANGDYYYFIEKYKSKLNYKIWKNIYEQIFMSIFIFHYLDLNHSDTHGGNFLYTKIKPGGCFHYKINNIDYYIENIGYKWMIWDYGISSKLSEKIKSWFFEDYIKIFFNFMKFNSSLNNNPYFKFNYNDYQAGYLNNDVIIPPEIRKIQNEIWEHLGGLKKLYRINYAINEKKTEYEWFKHFIDNNILFSKVPIGHIISTSIIKNNMKDKIKFEKFK
jgi:hypothetical protein